MEDTQDKVRRNLVVFSAAIVIGWFLDLKLTAITKLFAPVADIDNVNAGKLWFIALLVLFYLFLRYRFDSTTNLQLAALGGEYKTLRYRYLSKYLMRKISQINRTGKFLPTFDISLMESVNREVEKFEKEHSHKIRFHLHASNPWGNSPAVDVDDLRWEGTVGISEEYYKAGSTRNLVTSSGRRHNFKISNFGRMWITTHAAIHVLSYSKSVVDFIVPVILSGAALGIVITKLVATYLLS